MCMRIDRRYKGTVGLYWSGKLKCWRCRCIHTISNFNCYLLYMTCSACGAINACPPERILWAQAEKQGRIIEGRIPKRERQEYRGA